MKRNFLIGIMVMVMMIVIPFTIYAQNLKKVTTSKRIEVEEYGVTIEPTPSQWQSQPRIEVTILKKTKVKCKYGQNFWMKEKLIMIDGAIPGNDSPMMIDKDGEVDFVKYYLNERLIFKERYMQDSSFDERFRRIVDKRLDYEFPRDRNREGAKERIQKLLK